QHVPPLFAESHGACFGPAGALCLRASDAGGRGAIMQGLLSRRELLDVVQRARLFPDSKSFVDMPLRVDPEEALEAFQHVNKSDHQALKAFVEQNFEEAGGELTPCTPDDFPEQLPALAKISQQGLKRWAAALHHLWKDLCRKQKPSVAEKPWRFSALPQKRQMVVPGGRFRETYYW
ncbi:unnamed protein product, partial [Effrenium voratum]